MTPTLAAMVQHCLLSQSEATELDRLIHLDREQYLAQLPPGLAQKAMLGMELLESLQVLQEQQAPPGATLH